MPKGTPVDIESLHVILWDCSDRLGRVELQQQELADQLGVTKFTMSRAISRMVNERRLRKLSRSKYNHGTFVVEDPEEWQATYGDD